MLIASSDLLKRVRKAASAPAARWIAAPVLIAAGLAAVVAQTTTVVPPTISLSPEPLYAKGARAKPTLSLALSVEFPTVGAQYLPGSSSATDDATYSSATKYIGYYDTESCYLYNRSPSNVARRVFYRQGPAAADRTCGGTAFSGNFMNWATSSAIDILRLGLTGGDRVVDTTTDTVLQRAVLPNTSVSSNFWNGTNFPSKQLTPKQAEGALPAALLNGYTGTVYVANCLNRVHFGKSKTGSCSAPGDNGSLGMDAPAIGLSGLISGVLPSTPSAWTERASEVYPGFGPNYTVTEDSQVAYGAGTSWAYITLSAGGIYQCSNAAWATYAVPGLAASGDPIVGSPKKCFTRKAPPSTTSAVVGLTPDSFFYTRVQVCESDASGNLLDPRTSLCLRYPNGKYKPVGNLQKYSDRVRIAALGYLNDSSGSDSDTTVAQRSGGVIRSPMKYVGPRTYDANFALVSGANTVQEWDETTGVLIGNPDGVTTPNSGTNSNDPGRPISGVINYLNQFGRTGTFGQYKRYDPVGELYYESLRYLQGMPPTQVGSSIANNAITGLTDTLRDGFPVFTSPVDPHPAVAGLTDYSCVKNNIVGIGDINTHNDKFIPGNPSSRTGAGDTGRGSNDADNEPDFYFWTKVVGGFESQNAVTYVDGKGVNRSTLTTGFADAKNTARWGMENQNIGSGGRAAYYLSGMSYWAATHDIRGTTWTSEPTKQRPGMRVTTYWLDVNEFGNSSDAATRRASNQFYLSAKYGGFNDVTTSGNPFLKLKANTSPADNQFVIDTSNLNWQRQTTDTNLKEAKNYFLSSSAQQVLDALDSIFAQISAEANSIAGGAISTTRITTSGGLVYQAQFDPADWSGDVIAYPVTLNTAGTSLSIGGAGASPWQNAASQPTGAAGKLDEMDISTRNIYVGYYGAGTSGLFATNEFTWTPSLSSVVKTALYSSSEVEAVGIARLNYLRGNRSLEAGSGAGTFRKRGSRLGDIINSGLAYVGPPSRRIADDTYASFYSTNVNRSPTIYVGSNDGMLHGFDANTGVEKMAYIPSFIVPTLKNLTEPTYAHKSYVDGTPAVGEANVGSSTSASWKTILVSGAGGGGQGVFALDVTDPNGFASGEGDSKILWEFTDRDDVDMGNVIGRPQIVKINIAAGSATPDYRYFAMVSSGVNNQAADGRASTTGRPALFFLRLDKSKTGSWVLGTNYFKVMFPVSDTSTATGIVNFATRAGYVGELTYVYLGDLQGNLWKLDFANTALNAGDWTLDKLSFYKNGTAAIPMFVARDGQTTPKRQPISMEPTLTFGPNRSIIVSFGTGQFLSVADAAGPFTAQSVYALFDNNSNVADSSSPTAAIAGRGRLQGASSVTADAVTVPSFTWGRPTTDDATTSRAGWYFDFNNSATSGERQISGTEVLAGRMTFGSVIPPVSTCDNGTGKLYLIDLLTGNGTSTISTVGILGEPFVTTLGSSSLTISGSSGTRKETARTQIITQGSSGLATLPSTLLNQTAGRIAWREISNFNDLKNAP